MEQRRLKILAVGMIPPPYLGQALAFERVVKRLASLHDVDIIDIQFQKNIANSGMFTFRKIATFARILFLRIFPVLFRMRYDLLYYTPSSASGFGLLKDIIYLLFLRPKCRKTVYHFHGTGGMAYINNSKALFRAIASRVMFYPDLAIRCADVTPNDAVLCHAKMHRIVFNGVDDPSGEPQYRPLAEIGRGKLTFIGAIIREKGVFDLVDIMAAVKAKGYSPIVTLVGQTTEKIRDELTAYIRRRDVAELFEMTGTVTEEEKREILRQTDVFVFPTFFNAETQPAAVIEAAAFGIPVVASDWRGLNTIVDNGVNGYLVPPHDNAGFADAIIRILTADDVQSLRRSARRIFLDRFTVDKHVEAVNRLLLEVSGS